MSVHIHPYKGYLNTPFNLYVNGSEEIEYKAYLEGGEQPILEGTAYPNIPTSLKFNKPGNYFIQFNDGTESSTINVVDGYKFGGSTLKNAFVFDNCSWVFIIMHDRTYFYNLDSEESYIEAISPDNVIPISNNFILLENKGQKEKTLFSLNEQKPILFLNGYIHFNSKYIIEINEIEETKIIKVFSLDSLKNVYEAKIKNVSIINNDYFYIIDINNQIKRISIDKDFEVQIILIKHGGDPIMFIENELLACYDIKYKTLFVYKLDNEYLVFSTHLNGHLASINGFKLINIYDRISEIDNFKLSESIIYDTTLHVEYVSFTFYPTKWDVLYTLKKEVLTKTSDRDKSKYSKEIELKSCTKENISIKLKSDITNSIIKDSCICLYNYEESFVMGNNYIGSGYSNDGHIYNHNNVILLKDEKGYRILSKNGYWDNRTEGDFDMKDFHEFGIINNKSEGYYKSLIYNITGKEIIQEKTPVKSILINKNRILSGGIICKDRNKGITSFKYNHIYFSSSLQRILYFNNGKWYLNTSYNGIDEVEKVILKGLFDNSKYLRVLLSEDGNQILYRNNEITDVYDYNTNEISSFDNLSYIEQINGMRPLFSRATSLQPVLINPLTGQKLSSSEMIKYKFRSCDNKFYADTELKNYIEYTDEIQQKNLSYEEFRKLKHKYSVSPLENNRRERVKDINELKKKFILSNFEYFQNKYPDIIKDDLTGEKWNKNIYNENPSFFINLFITEKGVALIRKTENDEIVAKIYLNCVLDFINYVSFSLDNRFVAIASYMGRGLFILFDLKEDRKIIEETPNRAVWNVTFSKDGLLAGYTSHPFTFLVTTENLNNFDKIEDDKLDDRSFLTFSPNGVYMALSEQGYVSKYDQFGNERSQWGHRPSSLVEIRQSVNPKRILMRFNDLSEYNNSNDRHESGIEDTYKRHSVASVSFSNDNKKLMMVGKDGVVIIRNLHLEENADE